MSDDTTVTIRNPFKFSNILGYPIYYQNDTLFIDIYKIQHQFQCNVKEKRIYLIQSSKWWREQTAYF